MLQTVQAQATASDSDSIHEAPINELRRTNRAFQSRVRELTAANDGLRREAALEARRLQTILHELALAAERVGDRPLASVMRAVAAEPTDLSSIAACGRIERRACALHRAPGCTRCKALVPALGVPRECGSATFRNPCGGRTPQGGGLGVVISKREREVLRLLTEGGRSPHIAAELGICVATVEVHRRNIMRKLDLHSVAALTKYAVREGLTSL